MSPQPRVEAPADQQVDRVERARKDAFTYAYALTFMGLGTLFHLASLIANPQLYTVIAIVFMLLFTPFVAAALVNALLKHKEALHRDSSSNP